MCNEVFPTMRTIGAQAKPAAKQNDDGKCCKENAGDTADAAPAVAEEKKGNAMTSALTREQALDLLKKYNKDPFHIRHALTVEGVMRWFAKELNMIQ